MRKHWLVAVVAVAAIGCSKDKTKDSSGDGEGSGIPAGSPECTAAVDHAVMTAAAVGKQKAEQRMADPSLPAEQRERIETGIARAEKELGAVRAALANRCTQDKRAPEILTCLNNSTDRPSMLVCLGKLPPDLKARAEADTKGVRGFGRHRPGGEGGEGGGPMAPGTMVQNAAGTQMAPPPAGSAAATAPAGSAAAPAGSAAAPAGSAAAKPAAGSGKP